MRYGNDRNLEQDISMTRLRSAILGIFAFAAMPALAQLPTDMKLEDAGFMMREANTPQKMARLEGIPPRKVRPSPQEWSALLRLRRSELPLRTCPAIRRDAGLS